MISIANVLRRRLHKNQADSGSELQRGFGQTTSSFRSTG